MSKEQIKKYKDICMMLGVVLIFIGIFGVVFLFIKNLHLKNTIDDLNAKYTALETSSGAQIADSEKKASDYSSELDEYKKLFEQQSQVLDEVVTANKEMLVDVDKVLTEDKALLEYNASLEESNESLRSQLKFYQKKLEKYEAYDVFMFDSAGKRTDCTEELLDELQEACHNKSVDNLPFYCAWIMIESEWHTDCKNPTSTATGLGQFLSGTAKWVYEDLMENGKGSYTSHELAKDPHINIQMIITYVDTLMNDCNGDLHKVIDRYRGLHDAPYLRKFDKYLAYFNTSIDKVAEESLRNFKEIKG